MKPKKITLPEIIIYVIFVFFVYMITLHLISAYEFCIVENGKFDLAIVLNNFMNNVNNYPFKIKFTRTMINGVIYVTIALVVATGYFYDASKKKKAPGIEHGSADWSSPSILKKKQDKILCHNIIVTQNVRYAWDNEKTHINMNGVIWGGAGSGKSFRVFITNILNGYGCYIVVDPKLEILNTCGPFLKKEGYTIKIYNIDDLEHSNGYNPFAYLEKEDDIIFLVKSLLANTKSDKDAHSNDPFWEDASELLLCCLIAYVKYVLPEEDHNIPNVLSLMHEANDYERSIRKIEEDEEDDIEISLLEKRMNELHVRLEKEDAERKNPAWIAWEFYCDFKLAPNKTSLSVLISVASRLKFYKMKSINDNSLYDELELNSLGRKKMAIFISIPPTDTSKQFLSAMMFTQMFKLLERNAKQELNQKLKVPVRIMIDEAKNVGYIPNLPEVIAYVRGFNAGVWLVYQSKSQMEAQYKDDWKSILENCDCTVFLSGNEPETLKYISEKLGNTTIYTKNYSRSYGSHGSSSYNEQSIQRALLTPDEVGMIGTKDDENHIDDCLVFIKGYKFLDQKYDTIHHPNWKFTPKYKPTFFERKFKQFKVVDSYDINGELEKCHRRTAAMYRHFGLKDKGAHNGQQEIPKEAINEISINLHEFADQVSVNVEKEKSMLPIMEKEEKIDSTATENTISILKKLHQTQFSSENIIENPKINGNSSGDDEDSSGLSAKLMGAIDTETSSLEEQLKNIQKSEMEAMAINDIDDDSNSKEIQKVVLQLQQEYYMENYIAQEQADITRIFNTGNEKEAKTPKELAEKIKNSTKKAFENQVQQVITTEDIKNIIYENDKAIEINEEEIEEITSEEEELLHDV